MAVETPVSGLLLWLLPLLFLLHDTEETIFLPPWLRRNREYLSRRFPALSRRLLPHLAAIGPARFAAMAAEELALLLAVTIYARFTHDFYPWLALFLAFGAHLLLHGVQAIVAGRFPPLVATSLFGLAYCGWGLHEMINSRLFTLREFILCGAAGCLFAAVNLYAVHRLTAFAAGLAARRRTR